MLISITVYSIILIKKLHLQKYQFELEKVKLNTELEMANQQRKNLENLSQKELELEKLKLEKKHYEELDSKLTNLAKKRKINMTELQTETKEMFLRGEQQRIKELISTAVMPEGIFTQTADLEQIRDRIAIRLQNLYEQSSEITLKFLSDIVNSSNCALRANIVKALMTIATPETLNMLFELNNDKDEKVKREVVKALKQLKG